MNKFTSNFCLTPDEILKIYPSKDKSKCDDSSWDNDPAPFDNGPLPWENWNQGWAQWNNFSGS